MSIPPDSPVPTPKTPAELQNLLFAALARGDIAALAAALAAGADPNAPRRNCTTADFGLTPLTYPYVAIAPRAVSMLLKAGADPQAPDMLGTLPLQAALKRSDPSGFASLIAAGANPTRIINRDGGSMLHVAARTRNSDYIYLARQFNMNARDKHGRTPLMAAIENNDPRMVEEIIRAGADITLTDNRGEGPLDIAQKNKRAPIIALLTAAQDKQERQALHDRIRALEEEMRDLKKLLQVSNTRRPKNNGESAGKPRS